MTRLAIEHNAVNLSQGITNEPVLYDLAWAGIAAILGGSDEGAEQLQTLTLQNLLSRHNSENLNAHTLKDLCQVLQPEQDRYNQYSFPFGLPELREAIADYTYRFYAFRPDPETQITVTAGATEGLSSTLCALCEPGDGLIVLQPFHEMYPNQARVFGLRPEYITLRETSDGWTLDFDELATAAQNARALILNTPHNPTGKVFTETELGFIADLCNKHDLFLITDEIYEHILYGDHIETGVAQRGDCGLATTTGALHTDFDFLDAHALGLGCGAFRSTAGSKRRCLSCTFEPDGSGGVPTQGLAIDVGKGDDGVVERGLDMHDRTDNVLSDLLLSHR